MNPLPLITNIQRECVHDGPGIRTTVFLKGCSLNCPWCCNPENILSIPELYYDKTLCDSLKGKSDICLKCIKSGGVIPLEECPYKAVIEVGKYIDKEHLIETLLLDKALFIMSGGGVTFSGGEPLLFMDYIDPVVRTLRANNVHTIAETTFFLGDRPLPSNAFSFDGFIVDLKLQPEMKLNDAFYLEKVEAGIRKTRDMIIAYRLVFTDSIMSQSQFDAVITRLKHLEIREIELLQCHDLAKNKYEKLGRNSVYGKSTPSKMKEFSSIMRERGITVNELYI